MGDWGIKVSAPGYGITTNDIRNLIMSSKYTMLKYHDDLNDSVTFAPGDFHKYIDFSHSLGYVPAYIGYYKWDGKTYNINAGAATGIGGGLYSYSWATSTIIRNGIVFTGSPYNGRTFAHSMQDCYDENSGSRIGYRVGKYSGNSLNGALRFDNVNIPKDATIISAELSLVNGSHGGSNTDIKFQTYGIDEDNTAGFSSNPMGRSQTSAVTTTQANINNSRFNINVQAHVQEITTRGGWASGNAMGFIVRNFSSFTPDGVYWEDDINSGTDSSLTIVCTFGSSITVGMRTIIFKDKISA